MFCESCARVAEPDDKRAWTAGADRAGVLLCPRCGEPLKGDAASPQLRAKFSQLERFGLAGRRPIVARTDEAG